MTDEHTFPPEPVPRQRVPAGQALLVIVVAMLVGSLFNAERLDYTAHTQPFGWQRTVAIHLTGPLVSVSRATGANLIRKTLAETADNEDPPPPRPTKDVQTAEELAAAPAGSSTTSTTTAPPRVPTAEEPVRVLVAGDSLMGWIGPAISNQLEGKPVTVIEDWKVGTGLARPDVRNWPAALEQDMTTYDPEVVVIGFGGNDTQDMVTENGTVTLGTKEWQDEYERRVVQVLNAVEKPGRTVYWVGLPITTRSDIEAVAPAMAEAVKAEIAIRPWAHYVDSRAALSKDGKYADYLPNADGEAVLVREPDGVHPNLAGAERIVATFSEELAEERNLNP